MGEKVKRVDISKLRAKQLKFLASLSDPHANSGVGNKPRPNPYPIYIKAENEVVYGNEGTGARITCGADRPRNIASGHGGAGEQRCAAIRMTTGPMGSFASAIDVATTDQLYANPSNERDAATCYISANSDVDEDFNLTDGTVGNIKDRSAFVAKADALRFISRDGGIKIIAGGDRYNSRGGEVKSVPEINFIVNNDESDLQPIPKGENLRKCLLKMSKQIQELMNIVSGFLDSQMTFNAALTHHTHPTLPVVIMVPSPAGIPVPGGMTVLGTTSPSVEAEMAGAVTGMLQGSLTAPSLSVLITNSAFSTVNALKNVSSPSYINSRNVKTT